MEGDELASGVPLRCVASRHGATDLGTSSRCCVHAQFWPKNYVEPLGISTGLNWQSTTCRVSVGVAGEGDGRDGMDRPHGRFIERRSDMPTVNDVVRLSERELVASSSVPPWSWKQSKS